MKKWKIKLIYSVILIIAFWCTFYSARDIGRQEGWISCSEAYAKKCAMSEKMLGLLDREIKK